MTLTTRHELGTNVTTPTVRKASRKILYWVIATVALLVVALIVIMLTGSAQQAGASLSPTSASPTGSKALAEVLRQHGVTVTATATMSETRTASKRASDTTIFLVDDGNYLNATDLRELERLSSRLIIMSPNFDQLDAIAPEVALAGSVKGKLSADCALPPVQRAKTVTGKGSGFRLVGSDTSALPCLGSGDGIHSLVQLRHDGKSLTLIGTRDAFSNEFVQYEGNAALALGLLGETPNLVWMLPTIAESSAAGATIGELTPAWTSTIMLLLILTVVAAAFWRGRRFGPLVIEALPVTVRASETMHGRARLYQKASAHLHAVDALRMGAIDRLSKLCGLPSAATVDDVIRAVAQITGRQSAHIAYVVRDAEPSSEKELIELSDALLELEAATTTATRPSSATMDTTATNANPEG